MIRTRRNPGLLTLALLQTFIAPAFSQEANKNLLQPPLTNPASAAVGIDVPRYVAGRLLLGSRAGMTDADIAKIVAVHGGKARRIGTSNLHIVDLPGKGSEQALAALLTKHPQLKFAEQDQRVKPAFAGNDPYLGSQWHTSKIGAIQAWDSSQGSGVTIGILDSGIDGTHPDLSAQMVAGWNFFDNNADTSDITGHGTAVAGAAAATINNGLGVAGLAGQARIMPLRVSDSAGYALYSTIATALNWAADHGARVANVSYDVSSSAAVQSAAQYMKSKGGLVTVSAGNAGTLSITARTTSLIVVSATDANDLKTSWSSYGSFVAISAPGQDIWTTTRGGGYGTWWGTSLASPVVAGVVGLMMAAKPSLSSEKIESLLFSSAVDLGAAGRDDLYGFGRVSADAAVQAALAVATGDLQAPSTAITAPLAGSTVNGTVNVDVTASDNVGVSRVELRVNGTTVASDTAAPFGFSWDSTKFANGMNSLVAYAFDAAGNSAGSSSVSVNVSNAITPLPADTSPPQLTISNPAAGARVSGTVAISVNASDNSGAAGIKLSLLIDGARVATGSGATLNYNWNTRKFASGGHVIQVVAQDAAGNKNSSSVSVTK